MKLLLWAFETKIDWTMVFKYFCFKSSNVNSTSNIDVFPPSILSPFLLHYFLASLQYFPSFRYRWFLPRSYWRFPLLFIYWQFSLHLPSQPGRHQGYSYFGSGGNSTTLYSYFALSLLHPLIFYFHFCLYTGDSNYTCGIVVSMIFIIDLMSTFLDHFNLIRTSLFEHI